MSRGRLAGREPLVLSYHAVSERWPAPLSVTPAALESQLRSLVERGYRSAKFSAVVADPPVEKTVVITFDDSYRSVLSLAAPILDRLGLVGAVFVPTNFVGSREPMRWDGIDHWLDGPYSAELMPMDWDELRELAGRGWELGSHTCTHPRLPELDDESLASELEVSRAELESQLQAPCRSIAYPYGALDERVVRAAGDAGYEAGAALSARLTRPVPLRWPRIGIYHSDSEREFGLKVHPLVRWLRSSPLAHVGFMARQALRRG